MHATPSTLSGARYGAGRRVFLSAVSLVLAIAPIITSTALHGIDAAWC